jgi:transaldolase / glucose-6-phosphate isomerase
LDVGCLLTAAQKLIRSCGADVPPADNPGVVLGTILGVLGKSGRDKVTIVASAGIVDFGAWLEQLLAESTGKHGKGLIPVDAEPLAAPQVYGQDRFFSSANTVSPPSSNSAVSGGSRPDNSYAVVSSRVLTLLASTSG